MSKQTISYHKTGYFSKLMCDYLAEDDSLSGFYGRFPNLDNFKGQLDEKKKSFSQASRNSLVAALKRQYKNTVASEATQKNITSLSETNTFTITTGHQLNLFTGPLYFLYKIFSVINLSEKLKETYSDSNFVPVYWMATEDHDFEEINYFNLFGKKVRWDREAGGGVGELSTEGLESLASQLEKTFGKSENGKKLSSLFIDSYTRHSNLTEATHYLGNTLFSEYGLVIVDGNDAVLKNAFIPFAEKELVENHSFKEITKTTQRLTSLGYPEQVHSREINLFYLAEGIRERIIEVDGRYVVNNTSLNFSEEEFLKKLREAPQMFSPNALLRPLYQETILPNLCYVGGGGELAYWFQLKDYFKSVDIAFPILLLRNSVLLMPLKYSERLGKLEVEVESLFKNQHYLAEDFTKQLSEIKIDFTSQKEFLKKQFEALYDLATQTDASFIGAVAAQEKKQQNGLENLEKRLLKAQKRKFSDSLKQLVEIQDALFPKQSLQERSINFSEFYLEYGDRLLSELKMNLDPLELKFSVIEL